MSVPELRFPEFEDEWEEKRLGSVVETVTSGSRDWAQYYSDAGAKFIRMTNIPRVGVRLLLSDLRYVALPTSGSEGARTSLQGGDILVSITAELGKIGLVPDDLGEAYINQHTALVRPSQKKVVPELLAQLLATRSSNKRLNRLNDSGAKAGLNLGTVRAFKICLPKTPEQKKIAAFLGVVDAKIAALRARVAGLERYKRGLMQALFSQTLRFTKPDGSTFPDWEERKLSYYLSEPKARNRDLAFSKEDVLSVSGDVGCVNQIEHMGRSYAGVSVKDYHIVRTGDVVYTKSPLKLNPYGIIKANFGRDGIVSTLYAVYRPSDAADVSYIHYYFSLDDNLNRYLRPIVRRGAKNDMKVNNADVLGDPVLFPSRDEQQIIAEALSAMDAKIAAVGAQLDKMEAFKKGLLQQMFV